MTRQPSSKRPFSKRSMRSAVPANVLVLAALPSLGLTSAQMLVDVGIKDEATLRARGPEGCFRSLRFHFGRRVSTNFIYALECAIGGIGWKMLEPARKTALREAARRIIVELEGRHPFGA